MALRLLLRVFLAGAIALDVLLAWHSFSGSPLAGCGGFEGCDAVLASSWGYLLGLPISIPALLTHLLLFALSFTFEPPTSGLPRFAAIFLSGLILIAAAWFVFVQAGILGHFCRLCLTDHALGCFGALIFLTTLPNPLHRRNDAIASVLAALSIFFLAGGQWVYPTQRIALQPLASPVRAERIGEDRIITVSPGTLPASLSELPFLGDAKAPTVIVVLFDFTCPNCRHFHSILQQALNEHAAALCAIILPVPIAPACNRYIANLLPEHVDACAYARLALALWRHNPDDFRAFCAQVIQPDDPAEPIATARAWAEERIGKTTLDAALADPWVDRRLQWDVEVFARLVKSSGRVEMPKLVIGSQLISGAPVDLAHFDQLLRIDAGVQ